MARTTIVQANCGAVRGVYDNSVFVWRGIRYARPVTKQAKFKAPLPVQPWEGVYDATCFKEVFPQHGNELGWVSDGDPMDEDCLYLNIWSPVPDDKRRPVLFWIHGGAFYSGAGSVEFFDGANLAKSHDVVVVTINYRLSYAGFLDFSSFSKDAVSFDANVGLKDQALALEWVYQNIAPFGGDPENITIFGESAGATSVIALMAAPSVRPFIAKAIAQSSAPDMVQTKEAARKYAEAFLNILDIRPDSIEKLLDVPSGVLVDASRDLAARISREMPGKTVLAPVLEDGFLPDYPIEAIKRGDTRDIPLLMGTNTDEGTIFAKSEIPLVPITKETVALYFRQTDPSSEENILAAYPSLDERKKYMAIGRDLFFRMPTFWFACAQSMHSSTWVYQFDYAPQALKLAGLGVMHGAEMIMVFGNLECRAAKIALLLTPFKRKVYSLSRRMQNDWVHFARYGELTWRPYTKDDRIIKIYGIEDAFEVDIDKDIRKEWESSALYKGNS